MLPHNLLSILLILPLALALTPQGDYNHGPIELDSTGVGSLWHRVDLKSRTAYLAILVNDSATISNATASWIGLGISEPTSGSMLGADAVTAEFAPSATDQCRLVDRYVPFVPFPLGEGSPSAFPIPDDCQDDGSWTLVRCERSKEDGQMILEVERSLDAHDTQDRDIVEGVNAVIYAYGGNFQYHGPRRSSVQVVFYEDGVGEGEDISAEPAVPDDVVGSMTILASNYTIPNNVSTLYACTSKKIELEENEDRMIVALEPVLDSEIDMVHHLTLFLCTEEAYAKKITETQACYSGFDNGIDGPLGNSEAGCSLFLYAYAKGIGRFVLPKEAGFLVRKDRPYLVMESHYDNPGQVANNVDSSGVKIYYTDKKREHEAASLLVGDSLVSRFGEKVKSGFKYDHTCPKECTSKFSSDINLVGSFLHMHTTGQEIYTNKFSKSGTFLENVNKVNFWSDSFQKYLALDPAPVLKPGEQLSTTCTYDTTKRPDTVFGLETIDEMCMDFLAYWPRQVDPDTGDEINICAFLYGDEDGNTTATACGDNAKIFSTEGGILPVENPKFEDNVRASTTFGDTVDICPSPEGQQGDVHTGGGGQGSEEPGEEQQSTTPSPSPSSSASSSDDDDDNDERACFPSSASVELDNGVLKRMDELEIGDQVRVGLDLFSPIFMFTHRLESVSFSFVRIETASGLSLSLTRGHYLYLNGELKTASNANPGDFVTLADGKRSEIVRITTQREQGLFNPQTLHGNIVVDGVLTSTYTEAVIPEAAHSLLAPLRLLHYAFGIDVSSVVVQSPSTIKT